MKSANIRVYTYMCITAVNEKGGHGYEKEQGGYIKGFWREEREGKSDQPINSNLKEIIQKIQK